jgi:polyhydroxyalkanoate synthase
LTELQEFQRQLARGLETARTLESVSIAVTPRESIFALDGIALYRYQSDAQAPNGALLIVYALVNRPDMADLEPGRSLIQALIQRGFDVYLIDWGRPNGADRLRGLDDHVSRYLDTCVDLLRERLSIAAITLLGICQGGTLATIYAALYPHKVARLITTVTPIDFHTPNDVLSHLIREVDIERFVASSGNVSGEVLNWLFLALKPYRLLQHKYIHFLRHANDAQAFATFMRMEQWIFDSPALAGRACLEFAKHLYQGNELVRGMFRLGGRAVDLGALTMPILNIYARDDHLVPPAASRALGQVVKSIDYTERELRGGHIGIYVGLQAPLSVPNVVEEWTIARRGTAP